MCRQALAPTQQRGQVGVGSPLDVIVDYTPRDLIKLIEDHVPLSPPQCFRRVGHHFPLPCRRVGVVGVDINIQRGHLPHPLSRTWPEPHCCAPSHDNIAKALRHNAGNPHPPVKPLMTDETRLCRLPDTWAGTSFMRVPEWCRYALHLFGSIRRPGPTSLVSREIGCTTPGPRVGRQWLLPFRRQSCCRLPSPGKR